MNPKQMMSVGQGWSLGVWSAVLAGMCALSLSVDVHAQPIADASNTPTPINEGADLFLDGSASQEDLGPITQWQWDVNNDGTYDNAFGETTNVSWATLVSLGVVDGINTIGLRVVDVFSDAGTTTYDITITNLAPTADAGGPYTITQFEDVDLDASGSSDPGGDTLVFEWDLDNDGQYDNAIGETPTVPWAILDGLGLGIGDHTIGLRVTDSGNTSNLSNTTTTTLSIEQAAPVADAGGPYTINEGQGVNLDASGSSEPNGETIEFAWDLDNDGQFDDATGETPSVSWNDLVALGVVDGVNTITVQVTNTDATPNLVSTESTTLTITNLAPTADAGGPYAIDEGENVTLDASGSSDPGGDTLTYEWDLDNDGQFDDATGVGPEITWATLVGLGVVDGANTIGLRVTDSGNSSNLSNSTTTTLTITNLAPTADAGGPYSLTQGQSLNLNGSGSSDPGGDTLTYEWDLDNDGQYDDATGATPSLNWGTAKNFFDVGDNTIGLRVTDSGNAANLSDTATATVSLGNAPPNADAGGPYTINEGQGLSLDGSGSSDPGGDDLIFEWDLDNDGQFDDATGETVNLSWEDLKDTYFEDGVNTISLRVTEVGVATPLSDTDTTTVTVTNLAPVVVTTGPYTIDEGEDLALDASGSSDPGGDAITFAWDLDNDGQFDDATGATPTIDWATVLTLLDDGINTIRVRVTDSGNSNNLSTTESTTVTINNLPPVADVGGPYEIDQGDDLVLDASASSDPGGDALIYEWDLDNDGQFDDATGVNPTIDWDTLKANFFGVGVHPVSVRVTDQGNIVNLSDIAATAVTVLNVPPTPGDDSYLTNQNTVLSVAAPGILSNDSDPGGDPISIDLAQTDTTTARGLDITVNANGSILYDPRNRPEFVSLALGESLDDTFTYTITDGELSATATVTITIAGLNESPVLAPGSKFNLSAINEDDVTNSGNTILAIINTGPVDAITDIDTTDPRGFAISSANTANGTWEFQLEGSSDWNPLGLISPTNALLLGEADRIRFVPAQDWNGTVENALSFVAWDQSSGTAGTKADASSGGNFSAFSVASGTADIVVNPVNDPPVINDDFVTIDEDQQIVIDVLANDTDVEGLNPSTVLVTVLPQHGTRGVLPDGRILYIPAPNYHGTDQFTYRVLDIGDNGAPPLFGTATVFITINPVNDPPTTRDDFVTTDAGVPVVIDVLANDTDIDTELTPSVTLDPATVTIETAPNPAQGQVTNIDTSTGEITFVPEPDFQGIATFVYRVFDTGFPLPAESNTATVVVSVSQTNIIVDTLDDNDDSEFGPGEFSLREAFRFIANDGVIEFDPAIFGPGLNTINLSLGELVSERSATIVGPGADRLEITTDGASRILRVNGGTLDATGLSFNDGAAGSSNGGAISVAAGAGLILDSAVVSNSSANNGGGIHALGSLEIYNSSIFGNTATNFGGGVHSAGGLTLSNSTVSENTALAEDGGGIFQAGGDATLIHNTIVFNEADTGGGFNKSSGNTAFGNNIIAGNLATETNADLDGILESLGGNLIGDPAATEGWLESDRLNVGVVTIIEPTIEFNSGPTPTHALLGDSPAIDLGVDTVTQSAGITTDQRGIDRFSISGDAVDAGAYEVRFLQVDHLLDENDGDTDPGNVSLREAIDAALPGDNIIIGIPGTITLNPTLGDGLGEFTIAKGLAIRGLGVDETTIDGADQSGIIYIPSTTAQVVLSGIRFANAWDGVAPGGVGRGGAALFSFGGVRATDCAFVGGTAQGLSGGAVQNRGAMALTRCVFSENMASDVGGALYNFGGALSVTECVFEDNESGQVGGAFANALSGNATLEATTFANNEAGVSGGAVHNSTNSVLVVRNSAIYENSAASDGGGINNPGTLTVVNSTISGNTANRHGGGLAHTGVSALVVQSTITQNTADAVNSGTAEGGGIYTTKTVQMRNTIVAQNFDTIGNAGLGNIRADISGAINSLGNNLLGNSNGSTGVVNNTMGDQSGPSTQPINPRLEPLADNGGPTLTHMPQAQSPAIDRGANAAVTAALFGAAPFYDQRGVGFDRILDGRGLEDTDPTVDVGAVEFEAFAPVFSSTPVTDATEDEPYLYEIAVTDNNASDIFTFSGVTIPYWTTFVDNGDGTATLSGTPGNDEVATSFDFRDYDVVIEVTDWSNAVTEQSFTLRVQGVNDAPTVLNDSATTAEDTPVIIDVLANDTDIDGVMDPATVQVISGPSNGSVVVNPFNGAITYTPDANYFGSDSFVYEAFDTGTPLPALSGTATVSIEVTPVNDAPVALDDSATVDEDNPVTIDVLANDSDVDGNLVPSSVVVVSLPANGTTEVNPATGAITYTPNANYFGNDSFVYRVFDDGFPLPALSDTATVSITVNPVNDAPVAVDDVVETPEDTPIVIDILANDTDVDGQLLPSAIVILSGPSHGTVDVDTSTGLVTYTPEQDYFGVDSFVYEITDDGFPLPALSDTATVTITVNAVNDPPVAEDDFASVDEDGEVVIDILANDSDVDGLLVPGSIIITAPAANGTTSVDEITGLVTYTPNPDFYGEDSFVYQVSDDGFPLPAKTDTATVTITVNGINDAPVVEDDVAVTDEDTPVVIDVLANDSDVDGELVPGSVTVISGPSNGSAQVNGLTGAITYTPNPDFNGEDSFEYEVFDDGFPLPALSGTATVSITINAINDPPVAVDDFVQTPEDTVVEIDVLANDSDVDGNLVPESVTVVSPPAHGAVEIDPATGIVTYTPDADFFGLDVFTYSVSDDGTPLPARQSQATVTIEVSPVNDAPRTQPDFVEMDEDTTAEIDVLANDSDVDGNLVLSTLVVSTPPSHGTVQVNNATGIISYTPNADYNGLDSFEYSITDDGFPLPAKTSTELVSIVVNAVNDAPRLMPDFAEIDEDNAITIDVLANDTDVDGNLVPASVTVVSGPSNGATEVDPLTGVITYTPEQDFFGEDSFVYSVSDDGSPLPALTSEETVTITVNPVNDAPNAVDDAVSTDEDTPVEIDPLANDTDVDGNLLPENLAIVSGPANGTAELDSSTGLILYTPEPDFNGTDTIVYSITDDGFPLPALTSEATITITVAPVNDAPRTQPDFAVTDEDVAVEIDVLANDTDVDGNLLPETVSIVSGPANGTAEVDPATGIVTYTPAQDYFGEDSFVYSVTDDGFPLPALSSEETVTITVNPVNDAPNAVDDFASTDEDTAVEIDVLANDSDVDGNLLPENLAIVSAPANGTAVINPSTGVITYTPAADFNGEDSFVYSITDDGFPLPALTSEATVTITVAAVNDAPRTQPDIVDTLEDTAVEIDVLANDSDVDGNLVIASLAVIEGPSHGTTAVDSVTGIITYTPEADYFGEDSFVYSITDDGSPLPAKTSTETVTITVQPVNDAPRTQPDFAETLEDTPVAIDVLANDEDVDGNLQPGSVLVVTRPANGTTEVDPATGIITYTPNDLFNGVDTFEYEVSDDGFPLPSLTSRETVTVTVGAVNNNIVANDDAVVTNEDEAITIDVLANDTDVDGAPDPASVEVISGPANGSTTVDPTTGAITYTPNQDFNGLDSFVYQVADDGFPLPPTTDTATVRVQVRFVNDAPVITTAESVRNGFQETPIALAPLSVDDVDVAETPGGQLTVRLSAGNGRIDASTAAGVTATGLGVPNATVELRGAVDALNATLATATFTGEDLFYGDHAVQVTVNDNGNTGAGGALTDTATILLFLEATYLEVSMLEDEVDDTIRPGEVSLREALANIAEGGRIGFAPGLTGTISLQSERGALIVDRSVHIDGPGVDVLTVSGGLEQRVFRIDDGDNIPNKTVRISGLTLADGTAGAGNGGAILNSEVLRVERCRIIGSQAQNGGGIYNQGALVMEDSTASGNTALDSGGFLTTLAQRTATIRRSTLTQNDARNGGAIFSLGGVTVVNSTLSGNRASANGGGLYHGSIAAAVLVNCTLTANIADSAGAGSGNGGGIFVLSGAAAPSLRNTLVAGNADLTMPGQGPIHPDLSGAFQAQQHNLIGVASGGTGVGGTDILLTTLGIDDLSVVLEPSLADNGGPTLTHALPSFSIAVEAGENGYVTPALFGDAPFADQRGAGFLRIARGSVDIGAYEVQPLEDDGSLGLTIARAAGQRTPTAFLPVVFDVVFTQNVDGFELSDVAFTGTAQNIDAELVQDSGNVFRLLINSTGNGTIRPRVAADAVVDSFGSNIVEFDYSTAEVAYDVDLDSDNDGIRDLDEPEGDASGNGIPNFLDPDSNGDGIPDGIALAMGLDPWSMEERTSTLFIEPRTSDVDESSGSVTVSLTHYGATSLDWSVTPVSGDWADISGADSGTNTGEFTLSYSANLADPARQATFRVDAPGAGGYPVIVSINQSGCILATTPENITATPSPNGRTIVFDWSDADGASSYNIYSSETSDFEAAILFETVTASTYNLANPPVGCFNGLRASEYTYWVTAVNDCGESEPVLVGLPAKGSYFESVFPAFYSSDGSGRLAYPDAALAVRLRSDEAIDPDTLWIAVDGPAGTSEEGTWFPVEVDDHRDLWVVHHGGALWLEGDVVTMRAGAETVSGVVVPTVIERFIIGAAEAGAGSTRYRQPKSSDGLEMAELRASSFDVTHPAGRGDVFQIGPDQVFEGARQIWVPVPSGVDAAYAVVYYHSTAAGGWIEASEVAGFLASSDAVVVRADGRAWLGLEVNHGGLVAVGAAKAQDRDGASLSAQGANWGGYLIMALVLAVLLGARRATGRGHRAATVEYVRDSHQA